PRPGLPGRAAGRQPPGHAAWPVALPQGAVDQLPGEAPMTATVAAPPRTAPVVIRHASALMVSTVASAALGFAFWVVAARWFPPAAGGQPSAALAAMPLRAGIAQLNLASLYARYVRTAGRRTRSVLLGGAAATTTMAIAASAVYLAIARPAGGALLFAV